MTKSKENNIIYLFINMAPVGNEWRKVTTYILCFGHLGTGNHMLTLWEIVGRYIFFLTVIYIDNRKNTSTGRLKPFKNKAHVYYLHKCMCDSMCTGSDEQFFS